MDKKLLNMLLTLVVVLAIFALAVFLDRPWKRGRLCRQGRRPRAIGETAELLFHVRA